MEIIIKIASCLIIASFAVMTTKLLKFRNYKFTKSGLIFNNLNQLLNIDSIYNFIFRFTMEVLWLWFLYDLLSIFANDKILVYVSVLVFRMFCILFFQCVFLRYFYILKE